MTSFLDRLKNGMKGGGFFSKSPDPKKRVRDIVQTLRWDGQVWESTLESSQVGDMVDDLYDGDPKNDREGFEHAHDLVKALFLTLYKADPKLTPKRQLERELHPARRLIEELLGNPKLQELQELTASDPVTSLVALEAMQETVREVLTKLPEPPPMPSMGGGGQGGGQGQQQGQQGGGQPGQQDPNGQGNDQNQQPQQQQPKPQPQPQDDQGDQGEQGDQGGGQQGGEEPDLNQGDQEFDPEQEEANQQETEWENTLAQALDEAGLDRAASRALEAAKESAEELDNLRRGIGLDDGTWAQMDPTQRLAMAEKLSTPEMKELASVIGRMRRFALGVKATRVNDVPHEAFDVETGNVIQRLLRSEYALLGHPDTTLEFYRRWAERECLQFKMRGHEEAGKGPIVIAIDKSGSMHGSPFNWAMAVAEALRRFAAEEDRDYYAMFFGSNNDRNRFEFPKGKGPFEKVLAFLSVAADGGTQFDGVLTEALKRASESFDGDGKGKADIVFVTDGMAHLSDDWIEKFNEERKRVGVRVYSVYIGGAYDMRYEGGPVGLLEKLSDAVIPVKELEPEAARHIFEKV